MLKVRKRDRRTPYLAIGIWSSPIIWSDGLHLALNNQHFKSIFTEQRRGAALYEWKISLTWWYQILEQTFHEAIFTYRKSIKMWQERLRALWQISLVSTQFRHSNATTLKLQWIFNNPVTNYSTRVFKIMWCPYLLEQVHSGIS